MNNNPIEGFLLQTIGLDSASIGSDTLQHLLSERQRDTNTNGAAYAQLLQHSHEEQKCVIEAVVVLETWFFRNHNSFDFIVKQLAPQAVKQPLRLLTLPCATGEEAYSLTMSMLRAGVPAHHLRIDAVDISQHALRMARQGCYRDSAFRGEQGRQAQQDFFQPVERKNNLGSETLYQIKPEVQKCVHWQHGNLLDQQLFPQRALFDGIFCRNLLIYLTPDARSQGIQNLMRWLKPTGLLCVGHAERNLACQEGFVQVAEPGVFACWHPQSQPTPARANPLKPPVHTAVTKPRVSTAASSKPAAPLHRTRHAHKLEQHNADLAHAEKLANQGALEAALQQCRAFLRAQPDAAQGHYLCALIHQAQQEDAQAERYFQQTLYLQPDHLEALHHLSMLLQRQGRDSQATSLRQRLQRLRNSA